MWGGRFSARPNELMQAINASIGVDQRLWAQDIAGSLAHVAMLEACKIVTPEDAQAIKGGLEEIYARIKAGDFEFSVELEDIHMNIEARLTDLIGPAAGRLHTARSRNDQVATDFRLWVREACDQLITQLKDLQKALLDRAKDHTETLIAGFTHLQPAQPISFAHHLLAYIEMFSRDEGRFIDARARMNESPLGAAALAGSPFPIDRHMTATALGFERPMRNSLDAVSSRDFALEFLAAASICAGNLSRLAEEMVIWSNPSFNFIRFSDAFSTGSSIMPQKRNPDAAELLRAKSGRITGALMALLTVMKGLPLAYSKDMQEDKPPVFDAFDALDLSLSVMRGMVRDFSVNREAMKASTELGFICATDLADWLVREADIPFREAHHITGAAVKMAEAQGVDLAHLSLESLQTLNSNITQEVYKVLSPESSMKSRTSYGATSPIRVQEQINDLSAKLI